MDNTQKAPKIMKESKNKIRVEFEDRTPLKERLKAKIFSVYFLTNVVWYAFRLVLMIGVCYVILFPFFSKIAGSFMSPSDFVDPTVLIIPKSPTLGIYKALFVENRYLEAFFNTAGLSLSTALLQTFVCTLIGYGLAKFRFKGNGLVMVFVILTMIVPHETIRFAMKQHFNYFDIGGVQGLGIPGLFQFVQSVLGGDLKLPNLTNQFTPMILLSVFGLGFKNGLYIFMMRQFFTGVPDELEESAYVDGSNTFRTFFQIILPLSVPMMITIFLFSFCWQWTDDFYTKLFFNSTTEKIWLMPDIFKTIPESLQTSTSYAAKALYESAINNTAGIMIILPLVILYLFCQKYLVQGIERSGLVG